MRNMVVVVWLLTAALTFACTACGVQEGGQKEMPDAQVGMGSDKCPSIVELLEKARRIDALKVDYIVTLHEVNEEFKGTIWTEGQKKKFSMEGFNGYTLVQIIDREGGSVYVYLPARNMAFRSETGLGEVKGPQGYAEKVSAIGARHLGEKKLNGIGCCGWRITDYENAASNAEVEIWMHHEYGLPMRIKIFQRGRLERTIEYKELKVGKPSEGTFELPEDVQFKDMEEIMDEILA